MPRRPGSDIIDCGLAGKPSPGSSLSTRQSSATGMVPFALCAKFSGARPPNLRRMVDFRSQAERALSTGTPSTLKSTVGSNAKPGADLPEARLAKCSKSPELGAPIRSAAHGIDPAAPEFRGAPPLRTLNLLKKLEPDIQKGGAPVRRPHRCFSPMARSSFHAARIADDG